MRFIMMFLFSATAFAQDVGDIQPVLTDVSNQDFLGDLLQSLGGLNGASALAATAILIKLLLKFLSTPWGQNVLGKAFKDMAGGWKLTIVTGLSLAGGVIGLMTAGGLSAGAALVHSTTLAAFMVFSNQIYKQFFEKKV